MQMSTFYPSYFWWKNPEPEVLLKVYIFNITNSEEFIAGRDKKLKLQEIGPITFQEILEHKDIVFHNENSTLSYTVTRRIVFRESANVDGILNQTVIVPNMASLSGSSHVADNFFLRNSFNAILSLYGTRPVVKTTIYNYFFNLTDPVLELTQNLVPFLVPTKETGILQNVCFVACDNSTLSFKKYGSGKINGWQWLITHSTPNAATSPHIKTIKH